MKRRRQETYVELREKEINKENVKITVAERKRKIKLILNFN